MTTIVNILEKELEAKDTQGSSLVMKAFSYWGRKLETLAARLRAAEVIDQLAAFARQNDADRKKLLFVHGRKAPEAWPTAGQWVVEPALMEKEEWEKCVEDFEGLRERVCPIEWEGKPEVKITAKELQQASNEELRVASRFFTLKEG